MNVVKKDTWRIAEYLFTENCLRSINCGACIADTSFIGPCGAHSGTFAGHDVVHDAESSPEIGECCGIRWDHGA